VVDLPAALEQDDGADDAHGHHEHWEHVGDRHARQHLRVAVRGDHVEVEVRPRAVVALRPAARDNAFATCTVCTAVCPAWLSKTCLPLEPEPRAPERACTTTGATESFSAEGILMDGTDAPYNTLSGFTTSQEGQEPQRAPTSESAHQEEHSAAAREELRAGQLQHCYAEQVPQRQGPGAARRRAACSLPAKASCRLVRGGLPAAAWLGLQEGSRTGARHKSRQPCQPRRAAPSARVVALACDPATEVCEGAWPGPLHGARPAAGDMRQRVRGCGRTHRLASRTSLCSETPPAAGTWAEAQSVSRGCLP